MFQKSDTNHFNVAPFQENTACKEDSRIPNYMSCQCKVGFVQMSVASDSPAMICEPAKKSGLCSIITIRSLKKTNYYNCCKFLHFCVRWGFIRAVTVHIASQPFGLQVPVGKFFCYWPEKKVLITGLANFLWNSKDIQF